MHHRSALDRKLNRARFLQLMAASFTVPALMPLAVAAQQATPQSATPVASPVTQPLMVRKNAKTLTADEKKRYTDAIVTLKNTPSPWDASLNTYDQFVVWHRDAFECDNMAAHMGPAFFPWHRMYLRLFEQQLQTVDPSVTVPYWDWTVDDQIDSYIWQDDFMGGNGDPEDNYAVKTGPFRKDNWEITIFDEFDDEKFPFLIRNLGIGKLAPDLPTAEDVEIGLALETYDTSPWTEMSDPTVSFRSYMEGWRDCTGDICELDPSNHPDCPGSHDMHNRVHLWVSGEMMFASEGGYEAVEGPFGTMAMNSSPNDPTFFLHHAFIDRLWSVWMARYGQVYEPVSGAMYGHNLNDEMWPFAEIGITATPAMMLDSRDLGYIYDTEVD
ncbi:MAG TPA: tyrosinase family protein [Thermomicrobiales bacterium]|nr:tyrosinase family protein [Thermomicrobiales bacterium]